MKSLYDAKMATDAEVLAALTHEWSFTFCIVERFAGKQIKSADPAFRAKLRKLVKMGLVEKNPDHFQHQWRLAA